MLYIKCSNNNVNSNTTKHDNTTEHDINYTIILTPEEQEALKKENENRFQTNIRIAQEASKEEQKKQEKQEKQALEQILWESELLHQEEEEEAFQRMMASAIQESLKGPQQPNTINEQKKQNTINEQQNPKNTNSKKTKIIRKNLYRQAKNQQNL